MLSEILNNIDLLVFVCTIIPRCQKRGLLYSLVNIPVVHGVWCMVYGVWCMVYGVWCIRELFVSY